MHGNTKLMLFNKVIILYWGLGCVYISKCSLYYSNTCRQHLGIRSGCSACEHSKKVLMYYQFFPKNSSKTALLFQNPGTSRGAAWGWVSKLQCIKWKASAGEGKGMVCSRRWGTAILFRQYLDVRLYGARGWFGWEWEGACRQAALFPSFSSFL